MKILFCQPIFLPNEDLLHKNVNSINSFHNIIKDCPDGVTVTFKIGGWSIDNDTWNTFNSMIDSDGLDIKRFDKNYGKAHIINDLTKDISESEYDYILTADSDILFLETDNFIQRLLDAATLGSKKLDNSKEFGMFSLNQAEQNCHLLDHLNIKMKYLNSLGGKEKIRLNIQPSGIAGGCIFTSVKNWIEVGGYRTMGVYAGDDAYYLLDTGSKGNTYFMLESLSIVHPSETNHDYAQWKVKVCQRDSHGKSLDFDKQIEEADEFWSENDMDDYDIVD